jgi:hypothetical protein
MGPPSSELENPTRTPHMKSKEKPAQYRDETKQGAAKLDGYNTTAGANFIRLAPLEINYLDTMSLTLLPG